MAEIHVIADFSKEPYRFLSNFYPATVKYNGFTFLNSESAFQAQKCQNDSDRLRFVNLNPRGWMSERN